MIARLLKNLTLLYADSKVLLVGRYNNKLDNIIKNYFSNVIFDDTYNELSVNKYDIIIKISNDGNNIDQVILQNNLVIKNTEDQYHLDQFLDQYSGSIMFINDDLMEYLEKLKDLDISKEIFHNISSSLTKLSIIFKKDKKLEHIAQHYLDFGQFLENLDYEAIPPSNYGAFDLLTTIIEDLTIYINEMFVSKVLKEVYIFEDSMQNNINYFKSQLMRSKDDDDTEELDFF